MRTSASCRRRGLQALTALSAPAVVAALSALATGHAVSALATAATGVSPALKLTRVASAERPILVLADPSSGALLVVEQTGRIRPIGPEGGQPALFDISAQVSSGNEKGLLGAAFSRDGKWLYTNHTNRNGDTEISATPWTAGKADTPARVLLLDVDQPYANHNGGGLVVDDAGVLWIGLGDGGSARDPQNRAQNLNTLLGKMLRIVPTPDKPGRYTIPTGNLPRAAGRPEIWGYGLRNPWRFSIDQPSRTVWIGDVGQNTVEEINAVPVTAVRPNFGWRRREGNRPFIGKAFRPGEAIEPVHTYLHSDGGCSVTGGVVYRGSAIPALKGTYLFSDYCDSTVRAITGRRGSTSLGISAKQISSFGVDASGEVYVVSLEGPIYRIDKR